MKIRNGFVSNSSSSSFICDVCGENVSGYDIGLDDADMYECEKGHVFCENHVVFLDDELGELDRYEIPSKYCPICQLQHITESDMKNYLLKKYGKTANEVKVEIQKAFHTYDDFINFKTK